MHARLFILEKKAALHGPIRHCTLIHFRKCGLHVFYLDHFQYVDHLYASLHIFCPYATCIKTPIRVKLSSPCETRWTGPHCLKGMVIAVFCPGLKKGMVLIEEKGHICSRNYILRALSRAKLHFKGISRAELFSEGTLHKFWATHPMFEM